MTDESRADRLRERRKASGETARDEVTDSSTTSDDSQSVKSQQQGTYMYLPEWQKRELDHLYTMLKADLEYEYDQPFEKNRHFYPLVVQAGLDHLADKDPADVHDLLEEL